MRLTGPEKHPASYRDPSGFVFFYDQTLYRQVNGIFKEDFEHFIHSGFYDYLTGKGLLIPHEAVPENLTGDADWLTTLRPQTIHFISYPYEWSFDMLKEAALLTLQMVKEAMPFGMMLKDATPYNVQLHKGKMTFIDTLSFERYNESKPWIAYRQFCESFLAPLALMHYLQIPLQQLLLAYPDGIDLRLVKKMLPFKSKWNLNVWLHLHLQAGYIGRKGNNAGKKIAFSAQKLKNIITSLEQTVRSFSLNQPTGVWSGYYTEAFQREGYVAGKKQIIEDWLKELPAVKTAIDAGANEGEFSELLAAKNIMTIAADADHFSVNNLYKKIRSERQEFIHPLIIDFVHPSPAIGVNNKERASLLDRVDCDLVLALAVVHHLAIGKNVSFEQIAQLFNKMGKALIVEFVPEEDEKTQQLIQQKEIAYPWYTQVHFEEVFARYFIIEKVSAITGTSRVMYLMKKKT